MTEKPPESTAAIADAIDSALSLGCTLLDWVLVFAVFAAMVIFAGLATGASPEHGLRRTARRPTWSRSRRRARRIARATSAHRT